MARKKAGYTKTPDETQSKAYLVNNQDVRGVGQPYAIPGTFREASLPVDPLRIFGSVTTLPLAALPVATETAKGIVELATSGENAASVVVQGNDSRINVVTTKGDIYGCSGTNTPARHAVGDNNKIIYADSSATTGLNWKYGGGLMGDWLYGDGFDGSLTLVANTTMTSGENVKCYSDGNLAGFTLTVNSSDFWAVLFFSGTLSNGTITATGTSSVTGGTGTVGGGGNGAGVDGVKGGQAVFVFAKTASSVTVSSNGAAGNTGGTAGAATGVSASSAGGAPSGSPNFLVQGLSVGLSTVSGAGGNGSGGAGAAISAANKVHVQRQWRDFHRIIFVGSLFVSGTGGATYARASQSGATAGSSNGGCDNAAGFSDLYSGSGSGGGCGLWGNDGGAGAAGVIYTAEFVFSNGGGGTGGGGGGLAVFVTNNATSCSCAANGGNGGAGGAASATNDGGGNGGSGGGGGSGGVALGLAPTGMTVTSSAGTGGIAGAGATGASASGVSGAAGSDGGVGRAFSLTNY